MSESSQSSTSNSSSFGGFGTSSGSSSSIDDSKSDPGESDSIEEDFEDKIERYCDKHGCSRRHAKKRLKEEVYRREFERFMNEWKIENGMRNGDDDFRSPSSRLRKMSEIVRVVIDNCDNWRELKKRVFETSGLKDEKKLYDSVMDYKWPYGFLVLVFDYILGFEMELMLYTHHRLERKKLIKLFIRMRNDHMVLRRLFMEDIVLQYGEQRAKDFLGDVFVKWLDPANTNTLLSFFIVDKSRRFFGNSRNSNVRSGNKRKDWRGPKAIPDSLCHQWNFTTCPRNWDCPLKHQCAGCFKKTHGLRYCPLLEDKFHMQRLGRNKSNDKFKKDSENVSNYSGYGGYSGSSARPRTQGTFTNLQFPPTNTLVGGNATGTNGFTGLPVIPQGMQLTMVPMMTPANNENIKSENNNGKGRKRK